MKLRIIMNFHLSAQGSEKVNLEKKEVDMRDSFRNFLKNLSKHEDNDFRLL